MFFQCSKEPFNLRGIVPRNILIPITKNKLFTGDLSFLVVPPLQSDGFSVQPVLTTGKLFLTDLLRQIVYPILNLPVFLANILHYLSMLEATSRIEGA